MVDNKTWAEASLPWDNTFSIDLAASGGSKPISAPWLRGCSYEWEVGSQSPSCHPILLLGSSSSRGLGAEGESSCNIDETSW